MELASLRRLAEWHGIQTSFVDASGAKRDATPEALRGVLAALGVPVESAREIRDHLRAARQQHWTRCVEPVVVAWDCEPSQIELPLPASVARRPLICQVRYEDGRTHRWSATVESIAAGRLAKVEGVTYVAAQFALPRLPWGYHHFEIETSQGLCASLILSAPTHSFSDPAQPKRWGLFAPMYAVHSERSWGAGDFGDWRQLVDWTASLGGGVLATLPLLPVFLRQPFDPSPYAPASRLFWNEFYIDVSRAPELERCAAAQKLAGAPQFQKRVKQFRKEPLVDYREEMNWKRHVLELLAQTFFAKASKRRHAFQSFLREHPEWEEYARFRAVGDRLQTSWRNWPERLRHGYIEKCDYLEETRRYHLYAQWLAREQMEDLGDWARQRRVQFYLDLPLGVHGDSFDVWRAPKEFALKASGGAPPDPYFTKGQNWGFPPLHPRQLREEGYRYALEFVRHQMRHAGLLRVDHVMGLHRLYWIPEGLPPSHGAYVRYRAEEWHALLNLESHRHRTVLAGENLGTVPAEVNESMARHHLRKLFVVQYELRLDAKNALGTPPAESIASLNTQDMPTFAAFWNGEDILDRLQLGLLTRKEAGVERRRREKLKGALVRWLERGGWLHRAKQDAASVLEGCLAWMAASPAEVVLLNLEDLWLETLPQNVPTTSTERPNWRRKIRFSIEQMRELDPALRLLRALDRLRRQPRPPVELDTGNTSMQDQSVSGVRRLALRLDARAVQPAKQSHHSRRATRARRDRGLSASREERS